MNIEDIVNELSIEKTLTEVVLEADSTFFSIRELKFDYVNNRVVIIADEVIEDD